jgi:SpoVK/Ycf46/Vps4 family AAA+-type ATPase
MFVHAPDFELADRMPCALVRLWLLRFLVLLDGHHRFITSAGLTCNAIERALGMTVVPSQESGATFDVEAARAELRALHAAAETQAANDGPPHVLKGNIARVQTLVGLTPAEAAVLTFCSLLHTERTLEEVSDWLGRVNAARIGYMLSVLMGVPESQIRDALSPRGTLLKSGLLAVDTAETYSLTSTLKLISDSFADLVVTRPVDPVDLLHNMVSAAPPASLGWDDYRHLDQQIDLLHRYLARALDTRRQGVNVFVHGEPGTGKSEMARMLAAKLGVELFEVANEDAQGFAVDGETRLRAYRAAQTFFARRPVLLVFDEVEDVFNDVEPSTGGKSIAQRRKGWINRILEENPVPTLWLSNSVDCLDPAFVRRFDMVLNVTVPPRNARATIIRNVCGQRLAEPVVARLAEASALTPAVVARAASVVHAVCSGWDATRYGETVERIVSDTLRAQGHPPLTPAAANHAFDPAMVNVECDLDTLARGLADTKSGRLCLYGPPGTGKSAAGKWLAQQLDMPLVTRRASDLLGSFVGETERNIANAFLEAARERAILQFDEIDSFLQERHGGRQSWEIAAVNEMLTQLESYEGVLVASTNLMDGLDPAALRRFDAKLKFDYLTPAQACALFAAQCATLGLDAADAATLARIAALQVVTPGDFVAVARRHRLARLRDAREFAALIEAECALKGNVRRAVGFVQ